MPTYSLKIGCLNVHGCNDGDGYNVSGVKVESLALNEIKLKGKVECVSGRM